MPVVTSYIAVGARRMRSMAEDVKVRKGTEAMKEKVIVYLATEVHQQLKEHKAKTDVPVSRLIERLVREYFKKTKQ